MNDETAQQQTPPHMKPAVEVAISTSQPPLRRAAQGGAAVKQVPVKPTRKPLKDLAPAIKKSATDGVLLRLFKEIINFVLLMLALSLGGIGLAGYYLVSGVCKLAFYIVSGFFKGIYYLILRIIERIVVVIATIVIIVGSGYLFLEKNPELKYRLSSILASVETLASRLANLPILDEVNQLFAFKKQFSTSLPSAATTLLNQFGGSAMPKELGPILGVLQDPNMIKNYGELLNSGQMGERGEGAVPLLFQTLMGGNGEARGAAFQALNQINTPEAKRALQQYQAAIQSATKQAGQATRTLQQQGGGLR